MNVLCEFFPGADKPIIYESNYLNDMDEENEMEEDTLDYEYSFDDSRQYSTMDTQNSAHSDVSSISRRNTNVRSRVRPHSFVGTQINKLQNIISPSAPSRPLSIAALPQQKSPNIAVNSNRIGQVQIPAQFKNNQCQSPQQFSPLTGTPPNNTKGSIKNPFRLFNNFQNTPRKSSPSDVEDGVRHQSPAQQPQNVPNFLLSNKPSINQNRSGGSTPQSTLQDPRFLTRSPNYFSDSNSPRRSPMMNYNVGNMNPRHADIETYWDHDNESSSKSSKRNTLSPNFNNYFHPQNQDNWNNNQNDQSQDRKMLYGMSNQDFSNGNIHDELRGRLLPVPNSQLEMPLQIAVDPVSVQHVSITLNSLG